MRITKGKKEEYKEKNLRFLEEVATGEGVVKLPCGVLYKEIEKGTGVVSPELTDVVSVHYRGTLANGREFDNSWKRGCPEAFRLNQVIEGWQEALRRMHVGDRWMIYIVYILTQNIPNCIHWNVSIKHQPLVRLSLFREFHRMAGSFYLPSLITAISPSGILKVIYICLIWLQVIYEISRK